ncbi:hypothetical protein [Serratia entomophila]|uniref:hypothetical protein n=1 Tax=Serratia entomophila TaxID=42906 RepID=UPI0021BD67E4|nr:hypothetical protein [Serratia entomophila]
MFTDINAAIEEAMFRRGLGKGAQVVLQRSGGVMIVRERRRGDKPMYSTDGHGVINTDEVAA